MAKRVFLVGSVPFADTEEVFRRCAEILGPVVTRLPDGERGGWLPGEDFKRTRGLARGRGTSLLNPPISQTVRVAQHATSTQIEFETLHYYPNVIASYDVFSRLREAGTLPQSLRYQVSIPTAFTGSIYFDHDQVRELWPQYEQALFRDVRRILDAVPHRHLAISWDVVEFGISLANPDPLIHFTFDELAEGIARAIDLIPADVECGLHFCYGGHNSNGMRREGLNRRELPDTALMVSFFNAVRRLSSRPISWLHLPVPRPREHEGYFQPLVDLQRAQTELYLGLLYPDDGVQKTLQRIEVASRFVSDFGIGAACGLNPFVSGVPAERLVEVLTYHRTIADMT